MKRIFSTLFILGILLISCQEDDSNCSASPLETNCNKFVNINEVLFNEVTTINYVITNVTLSDNCLSVKVSSSGCNTQNWDMNLVVSPNVVETLPSSYNSKIELINNEECLAVLEKEMTFDLVPLQIEKQNQIQLNIQGWDSEIIYIY